MIGRRLPTLEYVGELWLGGPPRIDCSLRASHKENRVWGEGNGREMNEKNHL
jgi:hypothetical protein